MMQFLRAGLLILFALTLAGFLFVWGNVQMNRDDTFPVITFDEELLEVSLHPDDAELLNGVKAYDEKDGDLTDSIIIESISNFIEPGVCNITYAVCDSNQHVTTAARKIRYTDYEEPRFVMKEDLVYSTSERLNLTERIQAVDLIDGDLSSRVKISSSDLDTSREGVYQISAQVSNSKGDVIYLNVPLYIEASNLYAPKICLKEYLVYIETGEEVDLRSMLTEVISSNEEDLTDSVRIDTTLDNTTPGTYQADYYVTDSIGRVGHTILNIVVEEEA